MAQPHFTTQQYPSTHFVESSGAILFNISTRQVCLVYSHARREWLLAKGRRNVGESRKENAIREAREETGYPAKLIPVTLTTRCTPDGPEEQDSFTPDEPRRFENVVEPFMVTHRIIPTAGIKLIWWFVGAIDENAMQEAGEKQFTAKLFGFNEALHALHYATDREVVEKAIEVFENTFGGAND